MDAIVKADLERQCYGMTKQRLDAKIEQGVKFYRSKAFLAISVLSDVQELMSMGGDANLEEARKLVNQVKYMLNDYADADLGIEGDRV